jgi:diguanylate cyclase (GGDEF)-like protein
LEAEYVRAELLHRRALIRTINLSAALLALIHVTMQLIRDPAATVPLVQDAALLAASLLLAALSFGPAMHRHYLPWANVVLPLRSALAAAHFVAAAVAGQVALLMTLPIMVISPFFFFGLRLPVALLASTVALGSFLVSAVVLHLPQPILWQGTPYLLIALTACAIAARQLEQRSRISFLESHLLVELAQRDTLTGVMNRRIFNQQLVQLWQKASAEQRTLAVLLLDIDHFRAYNDHYGHLAGDEVLRQIARAAQAFAQRPHDLLARFGGEEFGLIIYDIGAAQAQQLAEQLRRAAMQLDIEHRSSRLAGVITVSVGVAVVEPTAAHACWTALQLADLALYEAKTSGRNCVDLVDDTDYRLLSAGAAAGR